MNWEWGAGNNIPVNTHKKQNFQKFLFKQFSHWRSPCLSVSLSIFFALSNKLQPTYFSPTPQGALILCLLWIKLESLIFPKLVLPSIISKQHYKDSGSEIQKKIKILFRRRGKDCYRDVRMDYIFTYICMYTFMSVYVYIYVYIIKISLYSVIWCLMFFLAAFPN